jgi:2-keto-4-pentenoate hydratase
LLLIIHRIADDFFGAGCVLPGAEASQGWASVDLAAARGSMRINGKLVGQGVGSDIVSGHPLEALAWLANKRAEAGEVVVKGEIVLLGSVVKTHWLEPGDCVECEVEGLGSVKVTFE